MATSGIRGNLQDVQRVREDGGDTASTTIIKVMELAREGVEQKRRNETLPDRNTDMETKIVESCAAGSRMRGQLEALERQITALKTQLTDA